ncbi:hypothetical protein ACFL0Y_01530 [Patescibacteria group bacterium]
MESSQETQDSGTREGENNKEALALKGKFCEIIDLVKKSGEEEPSNHWELVHTGKSSRISVSVADFRNQGVPDQQVTVRIEHERGKKGLHHGSKEELWVLSSEIRRPVGEQIIPKKIELHQVELTLDKKYLVGSEPETFPRDSETQEDAHYLRITYNQEHPLDSQAKEIIKSKLDFTLNKLSE